MKNSIWVSHVEYSPTWLGDLKNGHVLGFIFQHLLERMNSCVFTSRSSRISLNNRYGNIHDFWYPWTSLWLPYDLEEKTMNFPLPQVMLCWNLSGPQALGCGDCSLNMWLKCGTLMGKLKQPIIIVNRDPGIYDIWLNIIDMMKPAFYRLVHVWFKFYIINQEGKEHINHEEVGLQIARSETLRLLSARVGRDRNQLAMDMVGFVWEYGINSDLIVIS